MSFLYYILRSPVFRIGGDEFVVILKGYDYEQRTAILEALDRQVEENIRTKQVIVSTGLADYRPGRTGSLRRFLNGPMRLCINGKRN